MVHTGRNILIKDPDELQREYRKLTRREQTLKASLVRHHNLLGRPLNIIVFGSTGVFNGDSVSVVPPPHMKAGDLVYVYSTVGSGSLRTLTISTTGGQSWTSTKVRDANAAGSLPSLWMSYCTFNGTWAANPVFAISGSTLAKGHSMHVFRAPKIGAVWAIDQGPTQTVAAASTTHVITGVTNVQPRSVTIVSVDTGADTWVSTSGAGWDRLGAAQYTATGSNSQTLYHAYQIQGYRFPTGATGNVTITASSALASYRTITSFYFT